MAPVLAPVPQLETAASELRLAAESSQLGTARRHVEAAAARLGLLPAVAARFVYAVNEAVTNAIRHGAPDAQGLIRLCTVIEDERLTVRVHDSGRFTMPKGTRGPTAEGGRGFPLMASFSDEVQIAVGPAGTTVSLSVSRLR
jgi:anti-sigma regulatory factor (Ser/Thr protein kinase)